MKKRWFLLISLLLTMPLLMAACGGDDEKEDGNDSDSSQLTGDQVEEAMQAMFVDGNIEPAKAITCAAEQPSDEDAAASGGIVPEGSTVTTECTRDDAVMNCTISMTVEGLSEPQSLPLAFNIVDEKLCGAITQGQ